VTVLAVLIPVAVIGLVVWIIVGLRQRAAEPFTSVSATAFYAHLMAIITATAALCGGVLLVKAAFGFWNIKYAYSLSGVSGSVSFSGPCPAGVPTDACNPQVPQFDFSPQRTQDLVLGLTLVVVGTAVAIAHRSSCTASVPSSASSPRCTRWLPTWWFRPRRRRRKPASSSRRQPVASRSASSSAQRSCSSPHGWWPRSTCVAACKPVLRFLRRCRLERSPGSAETGQGHR
jgi:hypothetical protein